jgi:hypothetical protein
MFAEKKLTAKNYLPLLNQMKTDNLNIAKQLQGQANPGVELDRYFYSQINHL